MPNHTKIFFDHYNHLNDFLSKTKFNITCMNVLFVYENIQNDNIFNNFIENCIKLNIKNANKTYKIIKNNNRIYVDIRFENKINFFIDRFNFIIEDKTINPFIYRIDDDNLSLLDSFLDLAGKELYFDDPDELNKINTDKLNKIILEKEKEKELIEQRKMYVEERETKYFLSNCKKYLEEKKNKNYFLHVLLKYH